MKPFDWPSPTWAHRASSTRRRLALRSPAPAASALLHRAHTPWASLAPATTTRAAPSSASPASASASTRTKSTTATPTSSTTRCARSAEPRCAPAPSVHPGVPRCRAPRGSHRSSSLTSSLVSPAAPRQQADRARAQDVGQEAQAPRRLHRPQAQEGGAQGPHRFARVRPPSRPPLLLSTGPASKPEADVRLFSPTARRRRRTSSSPRRPPSARSSSSRRPRSSSTPQRSRRAGAAAHARSSTAPTPARST